MKVLTQWERLQLRRLTKVLDEAEASGFMRQEVDRAMLLAVALKESSGIGLYQCGSCSGSQPGIIRSSKLLGVSVKDVIITATVDRGDFKGWVGKLYTDEQNINWATNNTGAFLNTTRGAIALASSWGTWQQTMRWYLPKFDRHHWYNQFNLFLSSEKLQALQAQLYLKECGAGRETDERLILSRYNAGAGCKRVTSYGTQTAEILKAVRDLFGVW